MVTRKCAECGYDLRLLDDDRCPECALPFDPLAPYEQPQPFPTRRLIVLSMLYLTAFLIPAMLVAVHARWQPFERKVALWGSAISGPLFVADWSPAGAYTVPLLLLTIGLWMTAAGFLIPRALVDRQKRWIAALFPFFMSGVGCMYTFIGV